MKNSKLLIVMANLLLILAGCTVSSAAPAPLGEGLSDISTIVVTLTPSATRTLPPVTQTPSPTPALTLAPSPTPTPTAQPTVTETPVAIPTPPGTSLTEQVLWLYETNNGCQLPCWWGMTPGQTTWPIAEEFLNRFDEDIYSASSAPRRAYYGVLIPLPTKVFGEDWSELGIVVQDDVINHIRTRVSMGNTPPGYLTQYMLSTFLTTYGQPAEVWLSTYSAPYSDLPFRVVLFYPDQGIAALYGSNGIKQGEVVSGCPQQSPVGFLSLWGPSLTLTFEEVKSSAAAYNVDFLSLEDSTEMDVTTFYETFKNPDNSTCLETPAHLWPTS
jgi:hypothetical protein